MSSVLTLREAVDHPDNRTKNLFTIDSEAWQPNPAPRFSRSQQRSCASAPNQSADPVGLNDWGLTADDLIVFQNMALRSDDTKA
ncbi:hypothetical protein [Erythrobacter sp. R86502]|uniref:hypothetical protein n=1 Tax=Erythrobacter sp. R86502 TaxID=3093846 RepID=UPI0036D2869A